MKFTKEHLYYIYAENNQHNRDRLSKLCNQFGINCLSNEGFKFLEVYSCDNGVSDDFELLDTDAQDLTSRFLSSDDIDEMLRAAALEEKKPRTKVEYVKVEASEAVYYFTKTDDDMYAEPDESQKYDDLQDYINNLEGSGSSSLYYRIETPMTERDELLEVLQSVWVIDGVDGQEQLEKIVGSGLFKLVN